MRARRIIGALLAASALASWSSEARAEDELVDRFAMEYEAGPARASDACPGRAAFIAAIQARTHQAQLAKENERVTIRFHVTLTVGPNSTLGQLDVHELDGDQKRTVSGRTCREVANGLALVAALILDPDASTEPEVAPHPEPPRAPAPAPAPPLRHPPPEPKPKGDAAPEWQASGGGQLGAMGGVGPHTAPVLGLFAELARSSMSVLAPSFRLAVNGSATRADLPVGIQSYLWLAATVRACPISFVLRDRLRLAPCGALQIGMHRGATTELVNPTSHTELWLAPVATGRLAWSATPDVTVELEGGALFPLRRTRFFLAPSTTIYEVPASAATLMLSARVRFL